jgi:hypothetical protein
MPVGAQMMVQGMEDLIQRMLDTSEIELLGREEIVGAKAYKLSLSPKEGEDQALPFAGTTTLWVDQKQWTVLKAHVVAPGLGEGAIQVRSFELNSGMDDELFIFEVPQGAEVIDAEDEKAKHMTLDEAEAQADFDLLTPVYVPAGATLVDVIQVEGAIVLLYDFGGVNFSVVQSQGPLPQAPLGVEEVVTVRDVQGTLVTDEAASASFLTWQENGVNVAVTGRIDKDEALKIAESLE